MQSTPEREYRIWQAWWHLQSQETTNDQYYLMQIMQTILKVHRYEVPEFSKLKLKWKTKPILSDIEKAELSRLAWCGVINASWNERKR